jgi:catalase
VETIGRYNHREGNDDYTQPGNLWRQFDDGQKDRIAKAIADSLGQTPVWIQKAQLERFMKADPDFAHRIVLALKTDGHPEYLHGPDAAKLPAEVRLAET